VRDNRAGGGGVAISPTVTVTVQSGPCSSSTTALSSGVAANGTLGTGDCTTTAGNNSTGAYYDNFTFSGTSGQAVTITMNSTAFDTYLRLMNPSGTVVASDDDGNGGTNSRIAYTLAATGTFTVVATSYSPSSTGAYTVTGSGFSSGGTVPAAPSGLTATATSSSQINLTWTDNSTNETGFKIERKTGAAGTWSQITTTAAGATSYSNTGLSASTTYYYRVRATNATGDSSYSNEANATTQTVSELVTNGGFETTGSWTFATYSSRTSGSAQAGTYKAQQLGRGTTTSTNFWQTISGFNGTSRTLRFYLKMSSAEGTSTAYDYLRVRIYNSSGTLVSTLGTYSNVNKNTYANWTLVTLTIPSSSAVANYRLRFDASEDSSLQTTFFVDGVSIQ
jgi:hypothetical protein